jgi:hypothetical protein
MNKYSVKVCITIKPIAREANPEQELVLVAGQENQHTLQDTTNVVMDFLTTQDTFTSQDVRNLVHLEHPDADSASIDRAKNRYMDRHDHPCYYATWRKAYTNEKASPTLQSPISKVELAHKERDNGTSMQLDDTTPPVTRLVDALIVPAVNLVTNFLASTLTAEDYDHQLHRIRTYWDIASEDAINHQHRLRLLSDKQFHKQDA